MAGSSRTASDAGYAPAAGSELRQFILGDSQLAGDIKRALGTFNPRLIGMKERLAMRLDPDVAFGLAIVRSPIVNQEWSVEGNDPEICAFVDQTLRPIYRSLAMGSSNAIPLGYQVSEKVWTGGPVTIVSDDTANDQTKTKEYPAAWTFKKFKTIDPRTINFLVKDDEVAGVSQFMLAGKKLANPNLVGLEKIIHWAFRSEDVFGDPLGFALLDQVYEPWYFKVALSLICNRYFERLADPPIKGRGLTTVTMADGRKVNGFQFLMEQIQAIRSGGGIVLPSELLKGTDKYAWDAELLTSDQRGDMFGNRLSALTIQILRAMWITDKAATAGDGTGSLAQATEHGDRLDAMLESIVKEWLEVLNGQIVWPLVVYNFGEERARASRTCIRTSGLTAGKKALYADLMKGVMGAEASIQGTGRPLFIDRLDMAAIAKEAGVPLQPLDDVVELIGTQDANARAMASAAGNPTSDNGGAPTPDEEQAIADQLQNQGATD